MLDELVASDRLRYATAVELRARIAECGPAGERADSRLDVGRPHKPFAEPRFWPTLVSLTRRSAWHGSPPVPKGRQHPLTFLIAVACIVLLAGTVSPAFGGPTATGGRGKGPEDRQACAGRGEAGRQALQAGTRRGRKDRSRRPPRPARIRRPGRRGGRARRQGRDRRDRTTGRDRRSRPDRLAQRVPRDLAEPRGRGDRRRPGLRPRRRGQTPSSRFPIQRGSWPSPRSRSRTPTRPLARGAACCASATARGRTPASPDEPDVRLRPSRTERI